MRGAIVSIQVSPGGVPKLAVSTARAGPLGLSGDWQRNRKRHGGPDRALCLWSIEIIEALRAEGHPVGPGLAGENLTLRGLDWARLAPGMRLAIGATVLAEIASYTAPCRTIAGCLRDGDLSRIDQLHRPGWSRLYARVLAGGDLSPGDPVELVAAPS